GSDVVDLVNAIAAAVATIPASYTDLMAGMAPTYSTSGLYAVGSYAWYNGKLYRCTTAITSGETWTSGHWTLANLGSDLVDLKSALHLTDNGFQWWKSEDSAFYALTDAKQKILQHIRDIQIFIHDPDVECSLTETGTDASSNIIIHVAFKKNGSVVESSYMSLTASSTPVWATKTNATINAVINVLYDTNGVAASQSILNTTTYIVIDKRCVFVTNDGLSTEFLPADAKKTGGEIKRINDLIEKCAFKYDWTFYSSGENPTGWRTGNYSSDGSSSTQTFYMRTLDNNNIIHTIPGAFRFTVTAPLYNGVQYAVAVCEYDESGTFVKRYGDNDIRHAGATKSVTVDVTYGHNYKFALGRWANSDSTSYLTSTFTKLIDLTVYAKYDYEQINSYYFPYLDNKVDTINALSNTIDKKSFGFVFISDFHYLRNALQSPKLIHYVMEKTGIHTVVFAGDAFQNWKSRAEQNRYVNLVYSMIGNCGETDYYCVTGNHEWNDAVGEKNTQAGINAMTTNRDRNKVLEMDEYGNYFFDDIVSKTRFFCLSTQVSGSMPWTSILWLGNALYDVPDGYNVMAFAHAGVLKENGVVYQKNTWMNVSKLLGGFDRSAEDIKLYDSDNVLRGTFNYSQKNGTTICYLCGHTHEDMSIEKAGDQNGVLLICTTGDLFMDAAGTHYTFVDDDDQTITRYVGTIYEQAFDVIQIDPVAKKVYCTRIGAGVDRVFSY
ncbi:MAG: hypothetical protein IIZ93_15240, partial [Acidaminococcaceae bacterium]|nr:hypothetical protein [Acidaminococcaceae bacterium]